MWAALKMGKGRAGNAPDSLPHSLLEVCKVPQCAQVQVGGVHALPRPLELLGLGGGLAALQVAPGGLSPEQAGLL